LYRQEYERKIKVNLLSFLRSKASSLKKFPKDKRFMRNFFFIAVSGQGG
jgi:hypothetical protein